MTLSASDLDDLRRARAHLENPSFAARLVNLAGVPIEAALARMPAGWSDQVQKATHKALYKALETAVTSLDAESRSGPANFFHRAMTVATGAVGGAAGLGGLVIELPVTTAIMLRSIADIARSEGEDLEQIETRLACLSVFALGGRRPGDDAAETGYFAVRAVLAKQVADAARVITARGLSEAEAPALVRLIAAIASRFGVVVSEKAAAQLVPVLGAVTGAAVNAAFTEHFQSVATGHFVVRRLERVHGAQAVADAYRALGDEDLPPDGSV